MNKLWSLTTSLLLLAPALLWGAERTVIDVNAAQLGEGPLSSEAYTAGKALVIPVALKPEESGIFLVKPLSPGQGKPEEPMIVLERPAGAETAELLFQWGEGSPPAKRLIIRIELVSKTISKGDSLNMIFKAADGARVIPRLQISNGGSIALVDTEGDVQRMGTVPTEELAHIALEVDYNERKVHLFINGVQQGAAVAFPPGEPIRQWSITSNNAGRARWNAFRVISAVEEY